MKNFFLGIAATLLIAAVIGGAYYFGKQSPTTDQKESSTVTPTISQAVNQNIATATSTPAPTSTQQNYVSEQVIASIKTMNTQPLEGYFADNVNVRLESSSCCGIITKSEAISQLSYLDSAVNWDFDPTNPIVQNLATASPNYYGTGWIVGVASNEFIFSFKINSSGKVDAYNIGATYKLIIP